MTEDKNIVYVGTGKPVINYVQACMSAFKGAKQITVQARGNAIVRAVDTVEVLRNRFMNVNVDYIDIGTETLGEERKNVSTISIDISTL